MYNQDTMYEAILKNIDNQDVLTDNTLDMISHSIVLYQKYIWLAYDDDKHQFISNKELNKYLKDTLDAIKKTNIKIETLKIDSKIRIIKYQFTDIGIIITSEKLNKIYFSQVQHSFRYALSKIKEYGEKSQHIVFYDNLNVIFKMGKKGYIHLPFKFDIDFLPYEQSPVFKLPEFQLVLDLKKESDLTQYHYRKNKNFTFNQVLKYKNRNDFLLGEWKTMSSLIPFLNLNKFTYDELFMLRKIKPRFTDTEFRRLINWYHQNKELYRENQICSMEKLFKRYIKSKCGYANETKHKYNYKYLAYDIFDMSKSLKTKIEFNATSYKGLVRYHDELVQKLLLRKSKTQNKPFKLKEKWNNIHNALINSKLKIKHLNSIYLLDKENADMQHCVKIYDSKVKSGKSYIFHIDYYKKPYTCELVFRKNNIVINQLYGRYNQSPEPKLKQKLNKILEKINETK